MNKITSQRYAFDTGELNSHISSHTVYRSAKAIFPYWKQLNYFNYGLQSKAKLENNKNKNQHKHIHTHTKSPTASPRRESMPNFTPSLSDLEHNYKQLEVMSWNGKCQETLTADGATNFTYNVCILIQHLLENRCLKRLQANNFNSSLTSTVIPTVWTAL